MRPLPLALALAAFAGGEAGAQPATIPAGPAAAASDWRPLDLENTLVIETTKGRVIVEMRPEIAPLAVARVRTLTRRGYYDGALFYRVEKGYMAQTGDKGDRTFKSDLPNLKAEFTFRPGPETPFAPLGDVPGGQAGMIGSNPVQVRQAPLQAWAQFCTGAAAMPHYANPDTANSQIFLMRGPAPQLDRTFTVWGRVVQGMEALQALKEGAPPANPDRMTRVRVLADLPRAQRPELQVLDARSAAFAGLVAEGMKARGAAFTLCDVEVPVRPAP